MDTAKKRGRPPGTTRLPVDYFQTIFCFVEENRIRAEQAGKQLSVKQICQLICERGGFTWIVGGDSDAIAKWRQQVLEAEKFCSPHIFRKNRLALEFFPDPNGRVFVTRRIINPRTLRTRYIEAKKFAEANGATEVWLNMVRDRLGIPRENITPYASLAYRRLGQIVAAELNV